MSRRLRVKAAFKLQPQETHSERNSSSIIFSYYPQLVITSPESSGMKRKWGHGCFRPWIQEEDCGFCPVRGHQVSSLSSQRYFRVCGSLAMGVGCVPLDVLWCLRSLRYLVCAWAEYEGKGVDLPVDPHSYPHLSPRALVETKNNVKVETSSRHELHSKGGKAQTLRQVRAQSRAATL